jgi:cytochrome c553
MSRSLYGCVSLCVLLLAAGPSWGAGDAKAGQTKAIPCMGCHGIPGYTNAYPTYHVPKLGGQYAEYLILALKAYKTGERAHKTMRAQAASLSEKDMQDIAAFFSAQKAR